MTTIYGLVIFDCRTLSGGDYFKGIKELASQDRRRGREARGGRDLVGDET